jgi:hypothetical protein
VSGQVDFAAFADLAFLLVVVFPCFCDQRAVVADLSGVELVVIADSFLFVVAAWIDDLYGAFQFVVLIDFAVDPYCYQPE